MSRRMQSVAWTHEDVVNMHSREWRMTIIWTILVHAGRRGARVFQAQLSTNHYMVNDSQPH